MYEARGFRIDLTDRRDGIRLVRLTGELDLASAPRLRDCLTACLDEGRAFIVDLEAVPFLGSAGLQVLADVDETASARAVSWALAGSHRAVIRPLEVTGMDARLPLYPSITVAERHLSGASVTG
ncbi:STAS domain-containing protein [Amycolatopsis endophytica]|uniref:Anti-sigma factor antagonist n=1 Tax=Amycolatopsis endophytica TaxID=860233 RepID=A0A853BDR8_9PSEU|nr:STAS domain-containing protein [Amycolatopsis endophytica]NYI92801.1 anti-anti-sigma factor [Amycolatopsis endophytica]